MALPIIPLATFEVKNKHIAGGKLKLKPFVTGQEAILLQVKDSEDITEVTAAVKQIIQDCVVSPAGFDVDTLPFFVIELLFLRLRQHSVGEVIDLVYRCNQEVTEEGKDTKKKCGARMDFQIDLREVDITESANHKSVFEVSEGIGLELQYPSLKDSIAIEGDKATTSDAIRMCIKSIYQGEEVWLASDCSKEELDAFVAQIPLKAKMDIMNQFFNEIPTVKKVTEKVCPSCGHKHDLTLKGLKDFFG